MDNVLAIPRSVRGSPAQYGGMEQGAWGMLAIPRSGRDSPAQREGMEKAVGSRQSSNCRLRTED